MTDIHGLTSNALLEYVKLLCQIRGLSLVSLSHMAGKRTSDFVASLSAGSINARIRYIPYIVAALDLAHAEACAAYEYAGVAPLRAFADIASVRCYWELRGVMSAYDGEVRDAEYEQAVNEVLRRYSLPLITITRPA